MHLELDEDELTIVRAALRQRVLVARNARQMARLTEDEVAKSFVDEEAAMVLKVKLDALAQA